MEIKEMAYTIEQMSDEMHNIIRADPGPEGRKKVCELVKKACADAEFVGKHLPEDGPERKILYEDPEFKFCILAHVYHGAKESSPHDHGPTWAIYGQAVGETVMSDWDKVSSASENEPGKVKLRREYTLTPGMAYVYNEGDLHSPRRAGSTRLIRIEGQDVTKIRRFAYERVA
jgi:predicted metal-dependent enzyme (double-stranded beta helix superfamily)